MGKAKVIPDPPPTNFNSARRRRSSSHKSGTIHLRRRQIFTIFDPYLPNIGISAKCLKRGFLILMYCDLWTIGTWGYPFLPKTF